MYILLIHRCAFSLPLIVAQTGKIKEAFGMKEEEETPPPAVEEPEVEAAGDETPPAEEDA